jgi:hypothetical protein
MSRFCFLQIFWMMHVRNDTTKERNRAIKRTKKVCGVIEYINSSRNIFHLMSLLQQLFEQNSSLSGSVEILNPLTTWLRTFFQTWRPERVNGQELQP